MQRIKMNAVNAVQLFILVWTFTAVCRADDDFSVSCENVTGTVGKEVNFSCNVSLKKSDCCIIMYKLYYPEKYKDSAICREDFPDSCEQRDRFTCRFSSTTVMTGQFRFFVQTTCGTKTPEFPVDITAHSKYEAPEPPSTAATIRDGPSPTSTVIAAAVGGFILIIIIMTIIYKKKLIYSKPCVFLRRMLQGHRHNEDSDFQEQNPENVI